MHFRAAWAHRLCVTETFVGTNYLDVIVHVSSWGRVKQTRSFLQNSTLHIWNRFSVCGEGYGLVVISFTFGIRLFWIQILAPPPQSCVIYPHYSSVSSPVRQRCSKCLLHMVIVKITWDNARGVLSEWLTYSKCLIHIMHCYYFYYKIIFMKQRINFCNVIP